jgi:hypothetical protein
MAQTRDSLQQKEIEKFTRLGNKWAINTVMHDLLNVLDETTSGTNTYVGYQDNGGGWVIKYIDTSSGTSIRWASISNNTGTTDYTTAWTNRASLTYGLFSEAFPNS